MEIPIPSDWRQAVCRILHASALGSIIITQRASRDWQALFPGAFQCELIDAFFKALSNSTQTGRLVESMTEPGKVYEFIFSHQGRSIYGKVNLMPRGEVVIIYSAHAPLKGSFL